jgi:hypothetical protein
MNFLDIKTDFAFKKVFGSEGSKDILINFLNAVITFENNQKIKSLTIVDPYNIPMLKGMKDTYVDVKAELDNNSHVIIEMQVLNHEGFEKRILYNAAKKYSAQLKKGDRYHLLNPVIALTITDFGLFPEQKKESGYICKKSSIELALKTGKAEGKNEATKQMVLNMAKKKISIQIISDITGLTKTEVKLILDNDE